MKKITVVILSLLLFFSLSACGSDLPKLTEEAPVVEQFTFEGINGYIECTLSLYNDKKIRIDYENNTTSRLSYGGGGTLYRVNLFGEKTQIRLNPNLIKDQDWQIVGNRLVMMEGESSFGTTRFDTAPEGPLEYCDNLKHGNYVLEINNLDFSLPAGELPKYSITIEFSI